jgi:hypothetical protein
MVSCVPKHVPPEDRVVFDEEEARHRPGVTNGFTGGIALQRCTRSGKPDSRPEHLAASALSDPESSVEPPRSVGHGSGVWPVAREEFLPFSDRSLIDEQNRRICRVGMAGSA